MAIRMTMAFWAPSLKEGLLNKSQCLNKEISASVEKNRIWSLILKGTLNAGILEREGIFAVPQLPLRLVCPQKSD